jgi:hypothetical protein
MYARGRSVHSCLTVSQVTREQNQCLLKALRWLSRSNRVSQALNEVCVTCSDSKGLLSMQESRE